MAKHRSTTPLLGAALVALLLFAAATPASAGSGASMKTLIGSLSSPDPAVREGAAATIRNALAVDPKASIGDRGRAHWEARMAKAKPGMTATEVAALLPPVDGVAPDKIWQTGPTSGRSGVGIWRVDEYWVVVAAYALPDSLMKITELRPQARPVWVNPPAGFTGMWRSFHVNGQPHRAIQYKNGQYEGTHESFYDNGVLSVRQHYTNAQAHGTDEGWFRTGEDAYKGQYKNGRQHGVWTHWAKDGSPRSRTRYIDGARHGLSEAWHDNGQLSRQVDYKNNRMDGVNREWDAAGKLLWSRHFEAGKLVRQDPVP